MTNDVKDVTKEPQDIERMAAWSVFSYAVAFPLSYWFLEGFLKNFEHFSPMGATITISAILFLIGAHIRCFIKNRKVLWVTSTSLASFAAYLVAEHAPKENFILGISPLLTYILGIKVAEWKRCWFVRT